MVGLGKKKKKKRKRRKPTPRRARKKRPSRRRARRPGKRRRRRRKPRKPKKEAVNSAWILRRVLLCTMSNDANAVKALNEMVARRRDIRRWTRKGSRIEKNSTWLLRHVFNRMLGIYDRNLGIYKFKTMLHHFMGQEILKPEIKIKMNEEIANFGNNLSGPRLILKNFRGRGAKKLRRAALELLGRYLGFVIKSSVLKGNKSLEREVGSVLGFSPTLLFHPDVPQKPVEPVRSAANYPQELAEYKKKLAEYKLEVVKFKSKLAVYNKYAKKFLKISGYKQSLCVALYLRRFYPKYKIDRLRRRVKHLNLDVWNPSGKMVKAPTPVVKPTPRPRPRPTARKVVPTLVDTKQIMTRVKSSLRLRRPAVVVAYLHSKAFPNLKEQAFDTAFNTMFKDARAKRSYQTFCAKQTANKSLSVTDRARYKKFSTRPIVASPADRPFILKSVQLFLKEYATKNRTYRKDLVPLFDFLRRRKLIPSTQRSITVDPSAYRVTVGALSVYLWRTRKANVNKRSGKWAEDLRRLLTTRKRLIQRKAPRLRL